MTDAYRDRRNQQFPVPCYGCAQHGLLLRARTDSGQTRDDMEPDFVQWAIGQGGIASLAIMALYTLNLNYQTALRREREFADANREDKTRLLSVLAENTAALTKLTTMIEDLKASNDRIQSDRAKP